MFSLASSARCSSPRSAGCASGIIYFVSLLCGSLGVLIVSPNEVTVGASGAVFGLMSAAIVHPAQPRLQRDVDAAFRSGSGINLVLTFGVSRASRSAATSAG